MFFKKAKEERARLEAKFQKLQDKIESLRVTLGEKEKIIASLRKEMMEIKIKFDPASIACGACRRCCSGETLYIETLAEEDALCEEHRNMLFNMLRSKFN